MTTAYVPAELRHEETHSNVRGPASGHFVARFSNISLAVMGFCLYIHSAGNQY
jgi:hypothetical protein